MIPFQNFCLAVPSSGQDGRCYYLLTIPCTLSRMKVLHVLSNPIKPICFGYFSEILFVEVYNICASSYIFFKDSSCFLIMTISVLLIKNCHAFIFVVENFSTHCIFISKWKYSQTAHEVTSIKQSPVLKGHLFLVLSLKISYEFNLF